jgi:hypothetical protein
MKENHIAYKIVHEQTGLVCSHSAFEEDKMLDLLIDIQNSHSKGIYWIFKELKGKPQEALCIIDCNAGRIYYHHSGEVINISDMIKKLSRS